MKIVCALAALGVARLAHGVTGQILPAEPIGEPELGTAFNFDILVRNDGSEALTLEHIQMDFLDAQGGLLLRKEISGDGTAPSLHTIPKQARAGRGVVIDHGKGVFSAYAHLEQGSVSVMPGDRVKRGQTIAALGNSGSANFPHLHFQLMDAKDMHGEGVPALFRALPDRIELFLIGQEAFGVPAERNPGEIGRWRHRIEDVELHVFASIARSNATK